MEGVLSFFQWLYNYLIIYLTLGLCSPCCDLSLPFFRSVFSGSHVPQGMKVCVSEVMYRANPYPWNQYRCHWFIRDQEANRCDLRVSLNWTRLVHTSWTASRRLARENHFTPTRRLFSEVLSGPTVDLIQLKNDPIYCVPLKASWKSVRWNDASDVTKSTSLYIFVFHDLKSPHWDVWAWDERLGVFV